MSAVNGEDGAQLSDKLQIFKSEGFDPDGYVQSKCQTMSEKVSFIIDSSSAIYYYLLSVLFEDWGNFAICLLLLWIIYVCLS